jgi:NAD synthase
MAGGELAFDASKETVRITSFIRQVVAGASARGAVVGLSGGIDSSVTCALCAKALGKGNVFGLLLPSDHTPKEDVADARSLAESWGIRSATVKISPVVRSLASVLGEERDRIPYANLQARIRMSILYFYANKMNYLVAGCLGGDTLIHVGDSDQVPIGELAKLNFMAGGNIVLPIKSFNTETGTTELQPGIVVDSGLKQALRVTFDDGTQIEVTRDQKFLRKRSDGTFVLAEIGELGRGDEIGIAEVAAEVTQSIRFNEEVRP